MKRISMAVVKGGQGKTTVAVHLAAYAAQHGLRTLLIDLDDQANATLALEPWQTPSLTANQIFDNGFNPKMLQPTGPLTVIGAVKGQMDISTVEDSIEKLSAALTAWDDLFDICIMDTPPSITDNMGAAALNSDYILSPMEPEVFALDGVEQMLGLIEQFKELNPKLEFLGMLPNRVRNGVERHMRNVKLLREHYAENVIPFSLSNRDAFAEAMEQQVPCWELKKSAARLAREEFYAVAKYVLKKMGLKPKRTAAPFASLTKAATTTNDKA